MAKRTDCRFSPPPPLPRGVGGYAFPIRWGNWLTLVTAILLLAACGVERSGYMEEIIPLGTEPDWQFSLHPGFRAASLEVSQAEFDSWNGNAWQPETVAKRIYSLCDDVFDFILVVSNNPTKPDGLYYGLSKTVRNDVSGIGMGNFDQTASFGSAGQLQHFIHLSRKDMLLSGPALHEIMHRWGNQGLIPTVDSGHWGFSSVGGQLGGWRADSLVDLGNMIYQANNGISAHFGTNANSGNSVPYSNFELYLMGLIAPDAAADVEVATFATWVNSSEGQFYASGFTTYPVAGFPTRTPDYTSSQTAFRALAVMLTVEPLTQSEWEDFDAQVRSFSLAGDDSNDTRYNFWEATGGLATLQIDDLGAVCR